MALEVRINYRQCLRHRNDLMEDVIRTIEETIDDEGEQLKLIEPIMDAIAGAWPCCNPKPSKP